MGESKNHNWQQSITINAQGNENYIEKKQKFVEIGI